MFHVSSNFNRRFASLWYERILRFEGRVWRTIQLALHISMIVYGDPRFTIGAGAHVRRLREQLRTAHGSLDDIRSLLIQIGQLEQAIADFASPEAFSTRTESIQRVTDRVAAW